MAFYKPDILLGAGTGLTIMGWLDRFNGILDSLAAIAAIVASLASAYYYWKKKK